MSQAPGSSSNNSGAPQSMFHQEGQAQMTEQTVKFLEDGDVEVSGEQQTTLDDRYFRAAGDGLENSVHGFLSRPVIMDTFAWTSAQLVLANVVPIRTYPNDWLSRTMISQKTAGFRYFRGTLVVKVQINAQPFNAGRIIIYFNPFNFSEATNPSSITHLGGITGYRHVDLDLGVSTAAELRIPFMCPLTHIDLLTGAGNMGSVRGIVYSRLTPAAASVEGTVWAHFEDIDIQMPTGLPALAFSKEHKERYTVQGKIETEKKKGNIEQLFSDQSSVAKRLGDIPIIGEVARGVGWFCDQAAGLAGMFGFSKPTESETVTAVDYKLIRNMTNFNGKTLSKPMGLDARNTTVVPSGMFGTPADEMAIATIAQKPIYMSRFTMDTTQGPGTVLWRWPVHPASCEKITASPKFYWNNTYLSYLSHCFEFWRGGINYHFKVVKTVFHSARVTAYFVPGAIITTDFSTIDLDKCYKKVVDLRDANFFEFSIPFVANSVWKANDKITSGIAPSAICYSEPTGMIYLEVQTTLVTSPSAASSIDFIVETSACDDFQFAFSELKQQLSVQLDEIPAPSARFRVQSNAEPLFEARKLENFDPNIVSMGEAITSFRQVLKRYNQISPTPMPVPAATLKNVVYPYICQQGASKVVDLFSFVSQIYRMQAGGMRVMFASVDGATVPPTVVTLAPYRTVNSSGTDDYFRTLSDAIPNDLNAARPQVLSYNSLEKYLEVDVPFYQPYPAMPTAVGEMEAVSDNTGIGLKQVPFNLGPSLFVQNTIPYQVYRIPGEDFSFGYLIGPPLTYYTNPTPPPIDDVQARLDKIAELRRKGLIDNYIQTDIDETYVVLEEKIIDN
jgi:hypothetical protein